jgi:hypothetical protein
MNITESYTVVELLKALSVGDLSALDVTVAFSKRAAIAQQLAGNQERKAPIGHRTKSCDRPNVLWRQCPTKSRNGPDTSTV